MLQIKSAFKLNKENCKIDWTKSAFEINNLIRGLSPTRSLVHSFKTEEWTVKIYDAKILFEDHGLTTGMLICTKRNENRSRKWLYPDSKFAVSW
jgi:methionyl-tRNA formyltransferase